MSRSLQKDTAIGYSLDRKLGHLVNTPLVDGILIETQGKGAESHEADRTTILSL